MRERYTYDIATTTPDGRWLSSVISEDSFSRDPRSIARSLLEQWIIDHQGRLPGGRVYVYGGSDGEEPNNIVATVRVRVYRGDLRNREAQPVAVAYLAHAASDYPRSRSLHRGPDANGSAGSRLSRVRSRLRFPLPRPTFDGIAERREADSDGQYPEDDCLPAVRRRRRHRTRMTERAA
ncbi:hypothetical protein ABN028_31930 [Actinopolymorpha sp. B17G11]|uniref:hypothetical protein n=1 Tax=unclassified Actinopolymorpha TaxID=2627063 RepID=UPI0032D99B1E